MATISTNKKKRPKTNMRRRSLMIIIIKANTIQNHKIRHRLKSRSKFEKMKKKNQEQIRLESNA